MTMAFVVYDLKSDNKKRSLVVTANDQITGAGFCGFLEKTSDSVANVKFHFTPEVGGRFYLVSNAFKYPVYGCIDFYNTFSPRPEFGCILELDEFAVVKSFDMVSREPVLDYFYKGIKVGSDGISAEEVKYYASQRLTVEPVEVPISIRQRIVEMYKKLNGL